MVMSVNDITADKAILLGHHIRVISSFVMAEVTVSGPMSVGVLNGAEGLLGERLFCSGSRPWLRISSRGILGLANTVYRSLA